MSHAKAMFFVDDEKSQVFECHVPREQSMGANDDVNLTALEPFDGFINFLSRLESGEPRC